MTTLSAIQNDLDNIVAQLQFKGMTRVTIEMHVPSHSGSFYGALSYYDEHDTYQHKGASAPNYFEAVSRLSEHAIALPSLEDRNRSTYLQHIAKAIEFGKKIGIDEAFINPLELQMKKLSANIIEYTLPSARPNDDIPF